MKKRFLAVLGVVMLLLVGMVSCNTADTKETNAENATVEENKTIVVTDQNGEVEVPVNPEKVVVLDYGSLDILTKLGIEPVALPKGSLPTYLEKYEDEKYVDLGSLKSFDLEKINEVEPDLIIIEGRQASYIEDLKKIAPVLYLGTANSDIFASAENNAKILGKIFEQEEGVEAELKSLNDRLAAINAKTKEGKLTALMTMFNEGSLSVFGNGSRYDMVYSKLGFTVADEQIESSNHGQSISFEYLKEKNPDYILVLDKGSISTDAQSSVKDQIENELVKTTKSYENGHIIYVNPQAWYVGGAGVMAIDTILSDMETALGI